MARLAVAGAVAAAAGLGCSASDPGGDDCKGAKCDDPDDELPPRPGALRDAELLRCWLADGAAAGSGTALHCAPARDHRHPMPMTSATVVAHFADGEPVSATLGGAAEGEETEDDEQGVEELVVQLPAEPIGVDIAVALSFDSRTFPGLEALTELSFHFDIDADSRPGEATPLLAALPFDLWPVELTAAGDAAELNVPGIEMALAPATGPEQSESLAVADVVVAVDAGRVASFYLASDRASTPRDAILIGGEGAGGGEADAGVAGTGPAGSEFAISGPGHFVAEGGAVRPATIDDLAARLCVPPSVMMHSKDVDRLRTELIPYLEANGYTTITYQDLKRIVAGEQERPERPVILSIDDVPTDWIRSQFKDMVKEILEAGMTVSLAVNTTAPPDSGNPNHQFYWNLIREWQAQGVSLESHGTEHLDLRYHGEQCLAGKQKNCDKLTYLVENSINWLAEGTAERPAALITPFGVPEYDDLGPYETVRGFVDRAGSDFIVGIPLGRRIDAVTSEDGNVLFLDYPLFVGRVEIQLSTTQMAFELENWYRNTPECAAFEIAEPPTE